MYEVLAMIKPESSFSVDEMAELLEAVCAAANHKLTRVENVFMITNGDAELQLEYSDEAFVVDESNDIADRFKVPCSNCAARIEMAGNDPDMVLFTDYLLINENLESTEQFILFDPQECRMLFAD